MFQSLPPDLRRVVLELTLENGSTLATIRRTGRLERYKLQVCFQLYLIVSQISVGSTSIRQVHSTSLLENLTPRVSHPG